MRQNVHTVLLLLILLFDEELLDKEDAFPKCKSYRITWWVKFIMLFFPQYTFQMGAFAHFAYTQQIHI